MHTNKGAVSLEQFAVAKTEKDNLWSAQAMLAPFPPKAKLWATYGRSTASPAESGSMAPALQGQLPYTHGQSVLVTALVMVCYLLLGGLASPAVAKTIVVTTNRDVVNPPFNAGGLCGSGGTIANLPGADRKVSLREAIIAANNTPGVKTIKFAPSLNGATIKLTRGLALCGGHTTLNGDVEGNDTPDITLDGTAVRLPFDVLDILSSHNTVKNLQVRAPGVPGVCSIGIAPAPEVSTTVVDNTITHNTVTNGTICVFTGWDFSNNGQSFNGGTVKHVIVRDNTVENALGGGIAANNLGDHGKITDVTIAGNTVSGTTGAGIVAFGGLFNDADPNDGGATDNRLDVTIRNNTVTGNNNPGGTAGIVIFGGISSSSHNQVTAALLHNTLTDNNGAGISVGAGQENSSHNRVEVKIRGNRLENNAGVGIFTYGAIGALSSPGESSGNSLDARIERNTVKNAFLFGLWVSGGIGSFDGLAGKVANDNEVNAVVRDNTVTGTTGEGIHLDAGGSGEANDNEVDVTVRKNTVCGSTPPNADIHAIGGLLGNPFLPDNTRTGNELEGDISKNTATTVVVEDGVTDNSAEVTQSKNVLCP